MKALNMKLEDAFVAGAIALVSLAFGFQRMLKSWKSTEAETTVVILMRGELARLAELNTKLATEIGDFQLKVVDLNNKLIDLSRENSNLHSQVQQLTEQIMALQSALTGAK